MTSPDPEEPVVLDLGQALVDGLANAFMSNSDTENDDLVAEMLTRIRSRQQRDAR